MKVVIAPDRFGARLSSGEAVTALAGGWSRCRSGDEIVPVPLSDGGEGLLDTVARAEDTWITVEVVGPQGHPVEAALLLREDRTAVVESATACGPSSLAPHRPAPSTATTYGVGELLDTAREAGARRILVGLGDCTAVDGGAGALTGLGFRLRVADGSGLKIGGGELHRVRSIEHGWVADWSGIEIVLLADVPRKLAEATSDLRTRLGVDEPEATVLAHGLEVWAEVAERDLAGVGRYRDVPGSGAAGGLGFGLACALGARLAPGLPTVAALQGLPSALEGADLVVTGGGRLDARSSEAPASGDGEPLAPAAADAAEHLTPATGYVAGVAASAGVPVIALDVSGAGLSVIALAGQPAGAGLQTVPVTASEASGADLEAALADVARRLAERY